MKLIHEFRGFGSAITNLEPSSVVDVVAVGHSDGNTVLHNFRFDESVLSFKHSEESSGKNKNLCRTRRTLPRSVPVKLSLSPSLYSKAEIPLSVEQLLQILSSSAPSCRLYHLIDHYTEA